MLGVLLAIAAATPQPSPSPLKTITRVHSTPFCTAFGENIKHGVEGVLINDELFKRTEPVFLKAANDMVNGGELTSSFNSMHAAHVNEDSASVHFDMERLQQIGDAVIKNLKTIDGVLNDPARFPKSPATADDIQLVNLRAQLLALAKEQNDELNVLLGTTDQYLFDTLYSRDVSFGGALAANGKAPAGSGNFAGGPLKSPADAMNPELTQNSLFMSGPLGTMYRAFVARESIETSKEPQLAQALVQASAGCR